MERSSGSSSPVENGLSPRSSPKWSTSNDSQVVTLDVGGFKYTTTVGTLKKYPNTYFSGLFSGNYDIPRQSDGSIFVDRDGVHFRLLLNFLRSNRIILPSDPISRKELMIEAEFYCLSDKIEQALEIEQKRDLEENGAGHCVWDSNVIFIGYRNIDWESHRKELGTQCDALLKRLEGVQCPDTTEHVWKSIHDPGLTVIFQICHPSMAQKTDFSLERLGELLETLEGWNRPNLRFVLVYDAEVVRALLKLSGEKFNNSSYVWYFSGGKLIESLVQWKLKYVGENVWKHYYLSIEQKT